MFHPLAYTKTFALASVAVLAITLVPALCTILIRGRLRSEARESAGPRRDRGLSAGPLLPARSPGGSGWDPGCDVPAGIRAAGQPPALPRRRCSWRWSSTALCAASRWGAIARARVPGTHRPGDRADDHAAGARVHDAARRGDGHGHADHGPTGLGARVGRRPEGTRHGPVPVPGGRHGRGQGGPGRDADRPCPDGHDRDHGEFSSARILAASQASCVGCRPSSAARSSTH